MYNGFSHPKVASKIYFDVSQLWKNVCLERLNERTWYLRNYRADVDVEVSVLVPFYKNLHLTIFTVPEIVYYILVLLIGPWLQFVDRCSFHMLADHSLMSNKFYSSLIWSNNNNSFNLFPLYEQWTWQVQYSDRCPIVLVTLHCTTLSSR